MKQAEISLCQQCGTPLRGRSDKKFCDDQCRNNYNNLRSAKNTASVRFIHSILWRNRKILEKMLLNSIGKSKIHRNKISELGFDFRYHTHALTTAAGNTYYFCYDLGYAFVGQESLIIIRKPDKNKKVP